MNTDKIYPSDAPDDSSEVEESSATITEQDDFDLEEEALDIVTEAGRTSKVIQLLPVHAAPNTGKNSLKVTRSRGRPRKVERMPTTSDLEYHARITVEKSRHIDEDPVVRATVGRADSADMLHMIKLEVAKEAAALHFQRIENEKYGRDTAQVSTRRIEALNKIAGIELEIKKIGASVIDLKSEKMQRVFKYFIGRIQEVAGETLSEEQIDLFFNKLSTALEGWEEQCSDLVTNKGE